MGISVKVEQMQFWVISLKNNLLKNIKITVFIPPLLGLEQI